MCIYIYTCIHVYMYIYIDYIYTEMIDLCIYMDTCKDFQVCLFVEQRMGSHSYEFTGLV